MSVRSIAEKKIRVGVGRGQSFAGGATEVVGMELVALCRAVEASSKISMLAENSLYTVFNQELARL